MKIEDVLALSKDTKVLIMVGLDAGTKETFDVTLVRGDRSRGWRPEYLEWLKALNLEVKSISVCGEDTSGNKELLCIFCHPIKVMPKEEKPEEEQEETAIVQDPGPSPAEKGAAFKRETKERMQAFLKVHSYKKLAAEAGIEDRKILAIMECKTVPVNVYRKIAETMDRIEQTEGEKQ